MPHYLTVLICGLPWLFTASCLAQADVETTKCSNTDFSQVLSCYKDKLSSEPLIYNLLSQEDLPGLEWRRYQLTSQQWAPENLVSLPPGSMRLRSLFQVTVPRRKVWLLLIMVLTTQPARFLPLARLISPSTH